MNVCLKLATSVCSEYMCFSIYIHLYLTIYRFIYLSIYINMYKMSTYTHLYIYLSINMSIHLSISDLVWQTVLLVQAINADKSYIIFIKPRAKK